MHYTDLVQRYGADGAYDMLLIIEKLARLQSGMDATMGEDERLQQALDRLNQSVGKAARTQTA